MHAHDLTCCLRRRPRALHKARPNEVMRKTWKTIIEKAEEDELPDYEWLHEIADSMAPDAREAFLDAIDAIRGTADEAQLAAALDAGDYERVLEILGLNEPESQRQSYAASHEDTLRGRIVDAISLRSFEEGVKDTAHAAGQGALENTPGLLSPAGVARMRFDITNPHTVQAVNNYGFNLIREINNETRNGIRAIVAHAMEFGGHPYDQARSIKQLIGLTERQVNAVTNFRRLLESGSSEALDRELRDHRFDGTIEGAIREGRKLPADQIAMMVQRYADRMLNMRAETIARTETINAARLGTQNAWHQAREKGLLSNSLRQQWMVTPDDRLCEFCQQVPDMNPDGVPLGGQFETPFGPVDGPTLHPNCRCVVYIMSM